VKRIISFAAFFLATILPLFARDVIIMVHDTDLNLPLEGAIIRSWDGRQYICDENGAAMVSVPDDRQVVVQAVYPGYETGRLIVTVNSDTFTLGLQLSGIMTGRELVVEAVKPGSSETQTGRSVAVSGRDISQTAEIGIIEDVMNSVKLLPGVGYAGFFDAQPSIRGGDPGDMRASLDGFYIFDPYHWGGGFSIFDPRMVESAQLSHGVFSSRYGHTISGLLDIISKTPSPTEIEFELGVSTSAANFNLSLPLWGRGGILFMGRVTYYDPVVKLAQEMAKNIDELEPINAIRVAPYIRSTTITGNYRFAHNLDFRATGFFGMDGIGVQYGSDTVEGVESRSRMIFDYTNYQAFLTAGLSWNPRNDMLFKFSAGTGYSDAQYDGNMENSIGEKPFSEAFMLKYPGLTPYLQEKYNFFNKSLFVGSDSMFNVQGRVDYEWGLGDGILLAAGVQEMYSRYKAEGTQRILVEGRFRNLRPEEQQMIQALFPFLDDPAMWNDLRINYPLTYSPDAENSLITTSGYGLAEFSTPGGRFNAEFGLRVDHFVLMGKGIFLQSRPAFNPRLNMDFNVFKNKRYVQSLDISAGTGLFSSVNDNVFIAEKQYDISEIKPNRAWTSIAGTRLEFPGSLVLNIEGYYKYIFDRMYTPIEIGIGEDVRPRPQFDGVGKVWGIDIMLQRMQSRYWDGWVTYSYNWAKYRNPNAGSADMLIAGGTQYGNNWAFPQYHRFHNLNLVLNIKPVSRINIYTRFGLASGVPLLRRVTPHPESYPAYVYDPDDPFNPEKNYFIEKYRWPAVMDENNRTTPSLPMDVKLSIFGKGDNRKTRYEVYVAVENVLALLYTAQGNTSFNAYTGKVDEGSISASYEMPIPIPSFGFKISY
jgi:hypothetical protein